MPPLRGHHQLLAISRFGAGNKIATYIGYGLIAVGAIALARVLVDAVMGAFEDLKIAIILAVLGAAAYGIWVTVSPVN
tara:strand:- start:189 stop:422 length:234 start_codon:yes stop_codon:yes gene_type:complete